MTLGFSTNWPERMGELAGQPNYFIEKIWASMPDDLNRNTYLGYGSKCRDVLRECWDGYYAVGKAFKPKLHTIRRDTENRWKEGNEIHMVINNRTKDRFQFAPTIKCMSTQIVEINYTQSSNGNPLIYIGIESQKTPGYMLCLDTYNPESKTSSFGHINKLAINDGFDSAEDFFAYFNKDFKGKLIHWTYLKY